MSDTPDTPANTSRKRKRSILESSPLPEPEETKVVSQHSTQQLFDNVVINGALEAHEDDPALDWRTQTQGNDEIEDSDLDEAMQPYSYTRRASGRFKVPPVIAAAESVPKNGGPSTIHATYTRFAVDLCRKTRTEGAKRSTIQGLPMVVLKLESIELETRWEQQQNVATYAYALVVHVWQLVCLKMLADEVYSGGESLCIRTASYFLAAKVICGEHSNIDQDEFEFAVQHWESRLRSKGGNTKWLAMNLLRDVDGPDPDAPCYRNPVATEYSRMLEEEGLCCFALDILQQEPDQTDKDPTTPASPLRVLLRQQSSKDAILADLILMLFAMGEETIKAIIEGQLQRKGKIYHSTMYNKLNRHRMDLPGCYENSICDDQGNSPTPCHWYEVCEHMRMYAGQGLESDCLAAEIDQLIHPRCRWSRSLAMKGLRRYTEWRNYTVKHNHEHSKERRQIVLYFISQLEERLDKEVELTGLHAPLSAPVVEVGIATCPKHRLMEHRLHRNSNYLMNLAEACFEFAYPGMFKLQQFVVVSCWRPEQLWLSEMFVTRLAQGYVEGGGGFSHYPAGFSNGQAYRNLSSSQWKRIQDLAMTPSFGHDFEEFVERAGKAERERERKMAVQRFIDSLADVYTEMAVVEAQIRSEES